MGENGIGIRNTRLFRMEGCCVELDSSFVMSSLIVGCRFRFRSAFDSYSVASEAFSEQFSLRNLFSVKAL